MPIWQCLLSNVGNRAWNFRTWNSRVVFANCLRDPFSHPLHWRDWHHERSFPKEKRQWESVRINSTSYVLFAYVGMGAKCCDYSAFFCVALLSFLWVKVFSLFILALCMNLHFRRLGVYHFIQSGLFHCRTHKCEAVFMLCEGFVQWLCCHIEYFSFLEKWRATVHCSFSLRDGSLS